MDRADYCKMLRRAWATDVNKAISRKMRGEPDEADFRHVISGNAGVEFFGADPGPSLSVAGERGKSGCTGISGFLKSALPLPLEFRVIPRGNCTSRTVR
jgi:hypothetical protein